MCIVLITVCLIVHCVYWVYVCVFCTLSSVQSVNMYCQYVNCFCTVWSTLSRISLTKAHVLWLCDNKSYLIWFNIIKTKMNILNCIIVYLGCHCCKTNPFRMIKDLSFLSWDTCYVTIFTSYFRFYCEMAQLHFWLKKNTLVFWYYDLNFRELNCCGAATRLSWSIQTLANEIC